MSQYHIVLNHSASAVANYFSAGETALSTEAHSQTLNGAVSMIESYQARVPFSIPTDFAKKLEVRHG